MRTNNGPADRQSHARSAGLGGVERLEDALEMRGIDAWPGISHGHERTCPVLLGADQQLSCPRLDGPHCFDRVQDQVQQYLLQLNAIPRNERQSVSKPHLNQDAVPVGGASHQYDHLFDCRIKVETLLARRRLLDLLAASGAMLPIIS